MHPKGTGAHSGTLVHVCVLQYYNPYNATSGLRAFMKTVVCCREAQHELSSGRGGQDIWVACDGLIRSGEQKAQSMSLGGAASGREHSLTQVGACTQEAFLQIPFMHAFL